METMETIKNPYSESLQEIKYGLLDHVERVQNLGAPPYEYDNETFKACLLIFVEAMGYKQYLHSPDNPDKAQEFGEELREIIFEYTGIDTHDI